MQAVTISEKKVLNLKESRGSVWRVWREEREGRKVIILSPQKKLEKCLCENKQENPSC